MQQQSRQNRGSLQQMSQGIAAREVSGCTTKLLHILFPALQPMPSDCKSERECSAVSLENGGKEVNPSALPALMKKIENVKIGDKKQQHQSYT